jgi:Sulfotransferase family
MTTAGDSFMNRRRIPIEREIAMRRPVLVTGAHRSGTTWVARMIDLSPEVGYINEPFNPHHQRGICACRFPLWFQYINQDNEHQFKPYLIATLLFRYRFLAQILHTRSMEDVESFARDSRNFLGYRLRRARPLLKDPIAAFSSNWLSRTFGAATIVLVRHPAAFASSLKRLGWSHAFEDFLAQPALINEHLGEFEDEIRRMVAAEHDIVDQASLLWRMIYSVLVKFRRLHRDWLFIRHEDLVRDPVAGFARIYDWLGLDYSQHIQATVRWYSSGPKDLEANAPPYAIRRASEETVRSWKRILTAEEQSRIRAQVGSLAREFYSESEW